MTAPRNTVLLGDCVERLAELPDNSIDAIVTDPPYGLSSEPDAAEVLRHWLAGDDYEHRGGGFMGKVWDSFVPGPTVWRECLRVLKPGGHLLSFFGTRTYDLGVIAIRLAGFEVRDQVAWMYGSGFPKSKNLPGGWGTALKPAHEPVVVARKPLTGTVAANFDEWGTGVINIDGCRVVGPKGDGVWGTSNATTNPTFANSPNRAEFRSEAVEAEDGKVGRWPANVALNEEAAAMLDEQSGPRGAAAPASGPTYSGPSKSGSMAGAFRGMGEQLPAFHDDKGGASRFYYVAKASKADREAGLEGLDEVPFVQFQTGNGASGKPSSLSAGRDTKRANDHPTVKPNALMRWLVRLVGGQPGSLILDPFAGSGSTLRAAREEGFDFLGIERDRHYYRLACLRAGLPDPGEDEDELDLAA